MLELKKRKGVTKDGKEFDVFYVTVNLGKTTLNIDLKPADYTAREILISAFDEKEAK